MCKIGRFSKIRWISGIQEWDGNRKSNQQKMPDEGYNVNMNIIFYFLVTLLNPSTPFNEIL